MRPLDRRPSRTDGGGRDGRTSREPAARAARRGRRRHSLTTVAPGADPLVIFTPSGRRGRTPRGTTVLDAARALGVDIDSVCGGRGICGRCQVVPAAGSFPKHAITSAPDHLTSPGQVELEYARTNDLAPGRRLSCLAHVDAD